MSEPTTIGAITKKHFGRNTAELNAVIENAVRIVANSADPTRLIGDAIQKVYMQSQREGDEALRILALCLMCDLRRRRTDAGLPPISGLRWSGR